MKSVFGIALFSPWAITWTLAADTTLRSTIPTTPDSGVCSVSPLLPVQASLQAAVCPSDHTAAENTTRAEQDAVLVEPEEEEPSSSSGAWSGPHACDGAYCVYSHNTFAAGRGIVLITTPESAQALANLPIFTHLAHTASADLHASLATINTRSLTVEVRDVPGKGRGLVASGNQPIHRGTQVMAYTPALIIHRHFVDDLSRGAQLRLLRDAVSRVPRPTQLAFWKQLGRRDGGDDHGHEADDLLEIVINNSFNLPLMPGTGLGPFVGNFPEVSMYNHDCRPNVAFHVEHGLIHRTHAVRRIGVAAGVELSISYVDSFRVRAVRSARTMRNWGFACHCAMCSLPDTLANASDHRLWRIYDLERSLSLDANTDMNKQKQTHREAGISDSVELLLSLYEQEGLLESHGSSAYRLAALNYNAHQRRDMTIKYGLLALEQYIVEDGANSAEVREMVDLLDDVEAHWSWGKGI